MTVNAAAFQQEIAYALQSTESDALSARRLLLLPVLGPDDLAEVAELLTSIAGNWQLLAMSCDSTVLSSPADLVSRDGLQSQHPIT